MGGIGIAAEPGGAYAGAIDCDCGSERVVAKAGGAPIPPPVGGSICCAAAALSPAAISPAAVSQMAILILAN